MNELNFTVKNISKYLNDPKFRYLTFEKPITCPHCAVNTDSSCVHGFSCIDDPQNEKISLIIFIWRCTVCKKIYVSLHYCDDKQTSFVGMLPQIVNSFSDNLFEKYSPRFVELYNQALHAESTGDFNLAAVGFRSALEILIKDYAINCLHENPDIISSKTLFNVISEYLDTSELIKSADVIRILGNDHTHYKKEYPQHDFSLLKEYMTIFIAQIRAKLLLADPPVSRKSSN